MKRLLIIAIAFASVALAWMFYPSDEIDFNSEVKPIFNKKCIACHGGVRQRAGFSVLFRKEALAPTESGKPAIIPGKPDESELMRRITANDPEERMPFKHEPLTESEIATLRQWIAEGAKWGDHWAYVPVKKSEPPAPDASEDWEKNDI